MKAKNKKVAIGIAALLSTTFGVMGFVFGIQPTTQQVQAEAVEMTVDTLGNLVWNEVDGAVGYKWSYAINGSETSVDGGETLTNSANVATALQAAVSEAKALNSDEDKGNDVTHAEVSFTVMPVLYDGSNGETQEYVHKFREYVDYRYTTTDISEYMTTDSMTLPGQYTPITNAKFFKNDVFTFAMYADKTEANSALYRIAVGGEGTVGNNTANNYRLELYANGSSGWRTYLKNKTIFDGAVLNSQTYYYFSYAVLDTYTISGASSIGETVYLKASTYNEETRSLETYHEIEKFYSTWDIQQAKASGYYFDWNEDGDKITISAYGAEDRSTTYLSSADEEKIIKNQLSEEIGFAVDEFNTLSWNESYYGATGYQWTYTVGDTTSEVFTTDTNSVNVLAAIQAASVYAKENSLSKATVTFTVTPVLRAGKAIPLTYDYSFTKYYAYSGATHDIREYMTADTTTVSNRDNVFDNLTYTKNSVFTFATRANMYYYDSIFQVHVGGSRGENSSIYALRLYSKGTWQTQAIVGNTFTTQGGGVAIPENQDNYFKFAVVDTYDVNGTYLGETVCVDMYTLNAETQALEKKGGIKKLYTPTEITAGEESGLKWSETTVNGETVYSALFDISMRSKGGKGYLTEEDYTAQTNDKDAWSYTYLSTGSLSKILSKESGLKVDAFNTLSWNEVDGALGYKWTYTVGNAVSETFMTETNSVNVLEALQAAGTYATTNSLSEANVTFTVTPILKVGKATQLVYDYSFTQYYGYNRETHDIREYMLVDRTSIAKKDLNMDTMYYTKNTFFTFAVKAELSAYGSGIYQLNIGGRAQNNTNYFIRLWASGAQWRVWMGNNGQKGMSNPAAIPVNQDNYFTIAVFDTYDLSGNVKGETLYIRQSIYDETLGTLVTVTESTKFYTTAEIDAQSELHKWDSSTDENGNTVYSAPFTIGMYNNDPNATYADGTTGNGYNRIYLFTGDPNYVVTPEYDREANGVTFTNKDFYEIGALNSEPNTIEVELKVPERFSTSTESAGAVFSNAVSGYGLTLEVYEYGKPSVTFYATDGNKYRVLFDEINVATGYWMHLTITHDKANNVMNAYVNGEFAQAGSVVLASDLSAADTGYFDYDEGIFEAPFFLGSDYYQERNACFQGSVRSLAVYSDVRTADEILQDYEDGVAVADNELLVAYETPNTLAWEDISDLSVNGQTMNYYHWEDLFFTEKEAVTDYEYSFAVVGDPQIITNSDNLNETRNLNRIYDWIIANKESKQIEYVFTLGDIVNYNNDGSWTIAKEAISKLDGVLPYSIIRGNHDGSTYINQYFYYDAYTNQFSGFYEENKLENAWRTFTVADTDYLILNLDYQPKAAVLEWAADIVEAFPNHKVIITTHYYLTSRGNLSASGQLIWDTLASKYGNIFLVMGGHVTAQRPIVRQDKGVHGNTVTQMLIDPQCWDSCNAVFQKRRYD